MDIKSSRYPCIKSKFYKNRGTWLRQNLNTCPWLVNTTRRSEFLITWHVRSALWTLNMRWYSHTIYLCNRNCYGWFSQKRWFWVFCNDLLSQVAFRSLQLQDFSLFKGWILCSAIQQIFLLTDIIHQVMTHKCFIFFDFWMQD